MITKLVHSTAFRGTNMITPIHVATLAGTLKNGEHVHVEISKERPPYFSQMVYREPNGGPIYGVTIRCPDGRTLDPDPSKCVSSEQEAREYINSL